MAKKGVAQAYFSTSGQTSYPSHPDHRSSSSHNNKVFITIIININDQKQNHASTRPT